MVLSRLLSDSFSSIVGVVEWDSTVGSGMLVEGIVMSGIVGTVIGCVVPEGAVSFCCSFYDKRLHRK